MLLTTQGRARRLRVLALEALKEYDLDIRRVRLVNNETNCTFRVDTVDGEVFALRVSLPEVHSFEEIEAEVEWQLAISRETDVPVAAPQPSRSGAFVVTAGARGVPEERHCVLFSWLRGRALEEVASPSSFHRFGALAARLHRHGATFEPRRPERIRRLDALYPFGDPEKILDEATARLFDPDSYATLREMRRASKRELDWLFDGDRSPQLIHCDLHWWNVVSYRGRLQAIDFEDLGWGFPVQDIAVTLYYTARTDEYPELREAFKAGYETVQPWPEMYPGQIELLMVHRAVDLFNFVLNSTYREDRELLDGFVQNIQTHHRSVFEVWRSQFDESFHR